MPPAAWSSCATAGSIRPSGSSGSTNPSPATPSAPSPPPTADSRATQAPHPHQPLQPTPPMASQRPRHPRHRRRHRLRLARRHLRPRRPAGTVGAQSGEDLVDSISRQQNLRFVDRSHVVQHLEPAWADVRERWASLHIVTSCRHCPRRSLTAHPGHSERMRRRSAAVTTTSLVRRYDCRASALHLAGW